MVAGAARSIWNARVRGTTNEFCDALLDLGLLNAFAGGVGPTASVTPHDLETDGAVLGDTAQFIGNLVESHDKIK